MRYALALAEQTGVEALGAHNVDRWFALALAQGMAAAISRSSAASSIRTREAPANLPHLPHESNRYSRHFRRRRRRRRRTALAIVGAVAQRTEPITLADLSRATGYYKSTLLRLIASLERAALVVRRADGRYALGPYAHHLGRAYEATYRLTETILPLLQALVDKGTESASFHAYHDAQSRVCLLRVDSHHSTLDRIRTGDLLPLDKAPPAAC